jgi:hypothetical protein
MKATTREEIRYWLGFMVKIVLPFCSMVVVLMAVCLLVGWVLVGPEPVSAGPTESPLRYYAPLALANSIDAAALQIPQSTMPKGWWLLESRRLTPGEWMLGLGARDGYRTRWWDATGAIITLDTWVFLRPVGTAQYIDAMQAEMTEQGAIFIRPEDDLGVETLSYMVGLGQGINYTSLLRVDRLLAVINVVAINGQEADGESILWAVTSSQAASLLAVEP